jgi:hypothetical protein
MDTLLVPCPLCDGSAVIGRRVTVYEHGCGFPHDDTHEEQCPHCEGAGSVLIEGYPISMDDLDNMAGAA